MGRFNDGGFAMFSFDRIQEITISEETFKIEHDFDASELFGECYGVVIGDGSKPERIVLRAYGWEQYYVRDLPLHQSQKEILTDKEGDFSDFELFLRPTNDFMGQLLSRGAYLKVLEPQWLADKIRQWHEEATRIYEKK